MSRWITLDPCPGSAWEVLPGGGEAMDDETGEVWQYEGTFVTPGHFSHEFRHDHHPLYNGHVVWAGVHDGDAGPRLYGILIWRGGWDAELVHFDELGHEIEGR